MRLRRFALAASLVLLLTGCSSDSTTPVHEDPPTLLSTITTGADGGVWQYDGFQLQVPAGELPESTILSLHTTDERTPAPQAEVAPVLRIEGLPLGLGSDFPLRLAHEAADGDSLFAMVGQSAYVPSLDRTIVRWEMVACTDSAGWALFDLPLAGPATAGKDAPPPLFVTVTSGVATATSAGGRFLIHWRPDQVGADDAARLAQALENGLDLYDLLGYRQDGFTGWPIKVQVEPLASNGYWTPDPRRLGGLMAVGVNTVADEFELPLTAGHELMHMCQYFYDPRSVYDRGTVGPVHVWFNEATAVHMEIYFAPYDDYPTASRLGHELELLNGLVSPREGLGLADHGYGVSSLVRWLAREEAAADNFILDTYEAIAGGANAAAALQAATTTDIPARWQDILEQLVRGEVYADVTWPVLDAHPRGNLLAANSAADTAGTLVQDMADLSGALASVTLNRADWTEQHRLVLWTEQGDCGVSVLGITAGGGRDLVGHGTGRLVLTDPASLQAQYERLLVLVANPAFEGPDYAGVRPVTLQARVREAAVQPSYTRLGFYLKCDINFDDDTTWINSAINVAGADGDYANGVYTAAWDSTIDGGLRRVGEVTITMDPGFTEITSFSVRTGIWYSDGSGSEFEASGGGVPLTSITQLELRAGAEGTATCGAVQAMTGREVTYLGTRLVTGRDCGDASYVRFVLADPLTGRR